MIKGYFDFIEIGSADFDTLIEKANDEVRGITIEPLSEYYNNLPDRKNVIKVQAAISDKDGSDLIYYVDESKIKEFGLPEWTSGSNSLGKPHNFLTKFYGEEFYDTIVQTREVNTITFQTLVSTYNIEKIGHLKIDAEGHDHVILKGYLEACENNPNLLANTIICEYDKLVSNIDEMDEVLKQFEKYYYVVKGKNDCLMTTKQTVFYYSSIIESDGMLFQNTMRQNPCFYTTSGLIDFNLIDKPYILKLNHDFDLSYPVLKDIFVNPKMIFVVKDLMTVFSSLELMFRQNQDFEEFNLDETCLTTQKRVERWSLTLDRLFKSLSDGIANDFIFVRYEDFSTEPEVQLKRIYSYLEVPYFFHDYNYIYQAVDTQNEDPLSVLGGDTCKWIHNQFKWYFDMFDYR